MMNVSAPRNLNRLIATAARNAKSRQQNTAISVTLRLMARALKKLSSRTVRKLASDPPKGRNVGVKDSRVDVGSSEELTIQ